MLTPKEQILKRNACAIDEWVLMISNEPILDGSSNSDQPLPGVYRRAGPKPTFDGEQRLRFNPAVLYLSENSNDVRGFPNWRRSEFNTANSSPKVCHRGHQDPDSKSNRASLTREGRLVHPSSTW